MATSFVILGFEAPDPAVVYIDTATSALFVEETADVDAYGLMFDHLRASALAPGESVRLFRATAQTFT